MAFTYINGGVKQGTSTGVTSDAADTSGANLIVVSISDYSQTTASVLSDNKSNTPWLLAVGPQGVTNERVRLYYFYAPTVGAGHTFTADGTDVYAALSWAAFSGCASSPLDQTNSASGTSDVHSGSITPSQDNELIICSEGATGETGGTISDSMIEVGHLVTAGSIFGTGIAYKIQTTLAAINPFWSFSTQTSSSVVVASFKAAAGGGSVVIPVLTTMFRRRRA